MSDPERESRGGRNEQPIKYYVGMDIRVKTTSELQELSEQYDFKVLALPPFQPPNEPLFVEIEATPSAIRRAREDRVFESAAPKVSFIFSTARHQTAFNERQ